MRRYTTTKAGRVKFFHKVRTEYHPAELPDAELRFSNTRLIDSTRVVKYRGMKTPLYDRSASQRHPFRVLTRYHPLWMSYVGCGYEVLKKRIH